MGTTEDAGRGSRETKKGYQAKRTPCPPNSGPSPYPGPQPPRRSRSRCDRWSRCHGTRRSGPRLHPSRSRSHSPHSVTHGREGPWCWATGRASPLWPSPRGLARVGGECSGHGAAAHHPCGLPSRVNPSTSLSLSFLRCETGGTTPTMKMCYEIERDERQEKLCKRPQQAGQRAYRGS